MNNNINYFKSIFESFGYNTSNVKGFDSNRYFTADNGFFVIFCIFYSCYSDAVSAVTFLSGEKSKIEKMIKLEINFPTINNEDYFIERGVKRIDPILYNHDYTAAEIERALHSTTDYIKKYYSFKLK